MFRAPSGIVVVGVAAVVAALAWGDSARAAGAAAGCQVGRGGAALLVDRSASMGEHDPGGLVRRAVTRSVVPLLTRPSTTVDAFTDRLITGGRGGSISAHAASLLLAGDTGPTDLSLTLHQLAARRIAPRLLLIITDAEPADPVSMPRKLRDTKVIFVAVGGEPPAWADRIARTSGGAAVRAGEGDTEPGRRAANAVADVLGCTNATTGQAATTDAPPPPGPAPVVLISGLRDRSSEVRGARHAEQCAPALSLANWCRRLVADGRSVWVAAAAPGGRSGGGSTTLDSTGRLAANGAALAGWVNQQLPAAARPVYVGHSMGGLIAHAAVAWSGAPARGIVTVGTPHSGSFGADAYLAAQTAATACRILCAPTAFALRRAAKPIGRRFGPAIDDLTHRRRTVVAPLPKLPQDVPVAAYAGAPNRIPDRIGKLLDRATGVAGASVERRIGRIDTTYLLPNDGIVGVGSALGNGTTVRPAMSSGRGSARHSSSVLPPGAPTQLASNEVAAFISGAVERFGADHAAPWSAGRRAARDLVRRLARRSARIAPATEWPNTEWPGTTPAPGGRGSKTNAPRTKRPPRRITVPLQAVTPLRELSPGAPLPDPAGMVVSAEPVTIDCDGTPVAAIAVDDSLHLIDLGALGCSEAILAPSSHGSASTSPDPWQPYPAPQTADPAPPAGRAPVSAVLIGDITRSAGDAPRTTDWERGTHGHVTLLRRADGAWQVTVSGGVRRPDVRCTPAGYRIAMTRIQATRGAQARHHYRGTLSARRARRCTHLEATTAARRGTPLAATAELR